MSLYKFGYVPSHPDAVKLEFHNYVDLSKLPKVPENYGHYQKVSQWDMLGNDQYGDCVWAGGAHRVMLWNAANNKIVKFSDTSVLSDYAKVTGFNPDDPNTDQGTDPATAAQYEQTVGLLDAAGNRHKIGAYLKLRTGNWNELVTASYLFGSVGMAITVTDTAQRQFAAHQPWTSAPGNVEGGHYVPVVGRFGGFMQAVTWAALQPFDQGFFEDNNVELLAYVSTEYLTAGKSPEGFDQAALVADLKTVSQEN
jgi:hypothetical protein